MTDDQLRQLEQALVLKSIQIEADYLLQHRGWLTQNITRTYNHDFEPPLRSALTLTPDDVTFLRVNGIKPWR